MNWDDAFPAFAIAILAALALGLKATFDAQRVRAQLAGLTQRFSTLDDRLVRLAERFDRLPAAPGADAPLSPPAPPVPPQP